MKKGWFGRAIKALAPTVDEVIPAAVRRQVRVTAKQRQAAAWASAEKLAQCIIWSDDDTIECTRPDGEQ